MPSISSEVKSWNLDRLCDFIRENSAIFEERTEEYIVAFRKERIDGEVMSHINVEILSRNLNMSLGHAYKFIQLLEQVKQSSEKRIEMAMACNDKAYMRGEELLQWAREVLAPRGRPALLLEVWNPP